MTSISEGVRGLLDDGGVTEEEMGEVVPQGWRDRAFRPVRIADEGGMKVVGVPVGSDEFAIGSAIGIVRDGRGEQLAWMLPRMPDKQAANPIATGSMVQRTAYVERVMDPNLSQPACRRAENGAIWMLDIHLELPGTAEESSFFEEGCVAERLTLLPHQRAQSSLSRGDGGSECRRQKDVCIGRELGGNATRSPG